MSKLEHFKASYPGEFLFLSENCVSNKFFESLWNQLNKHGSLSEKQMACIRKALFPEPKVEVKAEQSYRKGDRIEIKNWIAKRFEEEMNLPFFFRNLIVEDCLSESARAVQLTVRFDHTVASSCHVCGKKLDDPRSKAIGIGPTCGKRMGIDRMSSISAEMILTLIKMRADKIGVVGPVWIPKSQVKLRDTEDALEGDFLNMLDILEPEEK